MLKDRFITSVVALPFLVLMIIYSNQMVWDLFVIFVIALCAIEWSQLWGYSPRKKIYFTSSLIIACLLVAGLSYIHEIGQVVDYTLEMIVLTFVMVYLAIVPLWIFLKWKCMADWVVGCVVWILFFCFWWSSVFLKVDPVFLIVILGLVFISDTTAYFCGKKFGRSPLAPTISPKKTWEGVFGALLSVVIYSFIIISPLGFSGTEKTQMLLAAMILVALGIFGDLFFSLLKRQVGKKDSGKLLPGHGGILDRVDSLVLSLPFAFIIVNIGN